MNKNKTFNKTKTTILQKHRPFNQWRHTRKIRRLENVDYFVGSVVMDISWITVMHELLCLEYLSRLLYIAKFCFRCYSICHQSMSNLKKSLFDTANRFFCVPFWGRTVDFSGTFEVEVSKFFLFAISRS